MPISLKQAIYAITLNFCFFILLMIGIQNSTKKSRVNLLTNETVQLPISFISGASFISGSLIGSLISIHLTKKN